MSGKLRIVLIYPPPWQIPSSSDSVPPGMPFGPPEDAEDRCWTDDAAQTTYGLLTLAAEARRAGHKVIVCNAFDQPWQTVTALVASEPADIYGISSFTANRRGLGAVAALVRKLHPQAHIVAGGPFVTALPMDTLRHFPEIDTAVIGEGEATFMELIDCLVSGRPAQGLAGTAWRAGDDIHLGPMRPRIMDLDTLASPFDYYAGYVVMTSRGCPSKCTFCGSFTTWGKKLRFHSAAACVDIFSKALARLPTPFLAIKDDTFTAHRRRAMAICDAIIERRMNFIWSCDSRVDSLDDELLRKMRHAGCQTISLGIESGSPQILASIQKKTTPEMILEATRAAQRYGMQVRYYLMIGNRGETAETVQQTIDLIKTARPSAWFICPLAFYPGTEEWDFLRAAQGYTPEIFFDRDFTELSVATHRKAAWHELLMQVRCAVGAISGFDYTLEERQATAERLPETAAVQLELANAYLRAGRSEDASAALDRAEALGFPIMGVVDNQRACVALLRDDADTALAFLAGAYGSCPNKLISDNTNRLQRWVDTPPATRGRRPRLNDSVMAMDFRLPVSGQQG